MSDILKTVFRIWSSGIEEVGVVSQKSALSNGHFENVDNFTTAEILIGKWHPMLMSTLTTNKLLWGMLEKRVLITRTLCKLNYALQGTHNTQVKFPVFAGSFLCPEEMTWP